MDEEFRSASGENVKGNPEKMIKVWNITPGRENEPNVLYAGIYIGTNTGQLFYSRDSGDAWKLMADFLPPIYSVEVAELEE